MWPCGGAGEPQVRVFPETTQKAPLCMGRDGAKRQEGAFLSARPQPHLLAFVGANCPAPSLGQHLAI